MTIKELKDKAKKLKVSGISKMKKIELIWSIQRAEGNETCFSKIPDCAITNCCFSSDCIK